MTVIDNFAYRYSFLSNFHASPIEFEGDTYPSIEHAYQAAKTLDVAERERIRVATSPMTAKRRGRKATIRSDWQDVQYDTMRRLIEAKFTTEPLRSKLLATGDSELIEGNHWGDETWGCTRDPVGKWVGKNWLGRILMEVRRAINGSGSASI